MKITQNTTDIDSAALLAMVRWVRKEIGVAQKHLGDFRFTNSRGPRFNGTGLCWLRSGNIRVTTPTEDRYPIRWEWARGVKRLGAFEWANRWQQLVQITAHEIAHVYLWRECRARQEARVERIAREVFATFIANEAQLVEGWFAAARSAKLKQVVKKAKPTPAERREGQARANLARWEKELAKAKRMRAKYAMKVKYYDKKAANRGQNKG